MKIDYAFFADSISRDSSGKINAQGIFDEFHCKEYPAIIPKVNFLCKIVSYISEIGSHPIKIVMIDEDGNEITQPKEGFVNFDKNQLSAYVYFELTELHIQKQETYVTDILIDNLVLGSIKINAIKVSSI